jgi:hypothetical protein
MAQDWSGYDLLIMHPDCTYLAVSGLHWNHRRPGRAAMTEAAVEFVRKLMALPCARWAIENPVGCLSSRIRKPDQIIQPWHFGDDASKATCLWLKNLPPLVHTNELLRPRWIQCPCCDDYWCQVHQMHTAECDCLPVDDLAEQGIDPMRFYYSKYYANQTESGQNKLGPSEMRKELRSNTYLGIAEAMADQWGGLDGKFSESLF